MILVPFVVGFALAVVPPSDPHAADHSPERKDVAPPTTTAFVIGGLNQNARASLDGFGIPTVHAASFADALRLEGFLHARDRFAQMDLLRRLTAGELCEITGALAIAQDQQQRVMQLRRVAHAAYESMRPDERALLEAYAEGVNAGIASLASPPPEHAFLRAPLAPWRAEDSLLVGLGMTAMLNDSARVELEWAAVAEVLPQEVIDFFRPRLSRWDAPVIADSPEQRAAAATAVPGATVVDTSMLRAALARERAGPSGSSSGSPSAGESIPAKERPAPATPAPRSPSAAVTARTDFALASWIPPTSDDGPLPIGSNGWAVAAPLTRDGRAILVNDMHLPITVPGVWYRMALRYRGEAEAEERTLDGVTLPGVPGIITGSNGHVAWGFTNVEGDFIDFVVVEPDPNDPSKYLVPGGSEAYRVEREEITIANAPPQTLEVRLTRWGPIVATDAHQRPLALVWAATKPGALNLNLLRMRDARTVREALDIAATWRGPQQNVVVADRDGHIGWTISGYLPMRFGMDGTIPTSWADGSRGWKGERPDGARPSVIDPPSGIIATANQRTIAIGSTDPFGRLWASPDRAYRIRERALADAPLDERACSAVQLDVRSPRLIAWRDRILPALEAAAAEESPPAKPAASSASPPAAEPPTSGSAPIADGAERARRCAALAKVLRGWNGDVTADSKAIAIVDRVRSRVTGAIARGIVETILLRRTPAMNPTDRSAMAARLAQQWPDDEAALQILDARPSHLLPPTADSWDRLIQETALKVANDIRTKDGLPRWGHLNASSFAHPLARALPLLASTFSIPPHDQPGHWSTVRVATPLFGASDRMVVSPGHEADGSLTTPAGQSANPSSSHYRDLHDAWRDGVFAPLLPGGAVEELTFTPATAEEPAVPATSAPGPAR